MRPQVGQVINNKYRLLRLIGDGGMGSVYEARHEVLGTSVALKFLHAELGKRPGLVQRFLQEARVSAQIQSPHVVRVTDVDQAQSGAFIVMEYIEGKTLQALYEDLYKAGLQLSYTDALEYAMQMLEGVEAAHQTGVVHRDLKPDNVMITLDAKGRPVIKLLDFGIAKLRASAEYDRGLTRPGVIMGTPEYMAPEQAFSADAVDARADIFSLGVIVFEMLAGRRPVGGEDPHQIASAYLSGQISRLTDLAPEVAPELAAAVHRAMAPIADDRWAAVADFRDAVEPFAVAARVPSVMPSTSLSRVSIVSGSLSASTAGKLLASLGETPRPAALAGVDGAGPAVAEAAGQRSVPKTLPPEDGPEAAPGQASAGRPSATSPGDPPIMSRPHERGPTPLGGFSRASGGIVDPPAIPEVGAGPPFIPATRSAAPISGSRLDPASTAIASPLSGIGVGPMGDPGSMGPAPLPYLPPVVPSVASVGGRPPKRAGALSSLPAILLLAAGVSAAVVGGVYLAAHRAKTDDHEDPLVMPVPSTTVAADPTTPPPDPTTPSTGPTTPVSHPWKPATPSQPSRPPLKGSATPVTPPAPSSTVPRGVIVIPSVLPPIFPNLPFDLPFGPGPDAPGGQQPSRRSAPQSQPQSPPASPPSPQAPRGERWELHRRWIGAPSSDGLSGDVRRMVGMLLDDGGSAHRIGPRAERSRWSTTRALVHDRGSARTSRATPPGRGAGLATTSSATR